MTQTLTPPINMQTQEQNSSHNKRSKSDRKNEDLEGIEQSKLYQKVERSIEAVEDLVHEILEDVPVSGGIDEALDDLMGYDTEYAEFLLQRDEDERKRLDEIEKIKCAETPAQRQQRLMREARMETRRQARNELCRDERNPLEKARDFINDIDYVQIKRELNRRGLLIKPWQVCTLLCMFIVMTGTNISVFGQGIQVLKAPNNYTSYCTNCGHKYDIKRSLFEEYSFYDIHPNDFQLQYHKALPEYPACSECNIVHQKLILVARPDRDERFLLATNATFQMPINQKEVEKLCAKYN